MGEGNRLSAVQPSGFAIRQRMVIDRIRSGESDCGLCGDYGAINGATRERVACMACGRDEPKPELAEAERIVLS